MEIQTLTLEPSQEKPVNKLKVDWPSKEVLIAGREKYVAENFEEQKKNVENLFKNEDEERLKMLTRLSLVAQYTMLEMRRISPLPVEVPQEFVMVADTTSNALLYLDQHSRGETFIKSVFFVNLSVCNRLLDYATHGGRVSQTTLEILDMQQGHTFDEAKRVAERERDLRVADLDIYVMGTAAQEFAHILFSQDAITKKSKKKRTDMREAELNFLLKEFLPNEVYFDNYYSSSLETRGRVWERAFLKRYFPDSIYTDNVEKELQRGSDVRKKRGEEAKDSETR